MGIQTSRRQLDVTRYSYEARDSSGEIVAGTVSAGSVEKATSILSDQDLFVVRLAERAGRLSGAKGPGEGRATRRQVAWFMTQLSIMVETGISISEAIHSLRRQSSDPKLRRLLEQVARKVDEGSPFSESLACHPISFPPTLIAMIRASEMNGSLAEVLRRCSEYLLNDLHTIRQFRGAIMYPLFMTLLSVGIVIFLVTFILPRFETVFAERDAALPAPTLVLMAISRQFVTYWFEWIAGTSMVGMMGLLFAQTHTGRRLLDSLVLSIPVLSSVMNGLYQSRTFRTIAVLLGEGVPIMDVVAIARDVTPNACYQALWTDVEQYIKEGNNLSTPLMQSPLIAEPIAQMIEAGERSGRMSHVLSRLADFLEEEYSQTLKTAVQMLEPCMILFVGTGVGFVAAALLLPLFQASQLAAM